MKIRKAVASVMIGMLGIMPLAASAKTYNVGSTPTGMPFTYLDANTNTIEGIMVDLINVIGKDLDFEPKITPLSFSTLISALQTKRIDIISAAMIKTEEREKVVAFSEPLLSYGEGVVVKNDNNTPYKNFNDMKGMTVAIQLGTAYVEPARASGAFKDIKLYDSSADMLRDLKNGRVDAVLLDYPIAKRTLQQPAFEGMQIVESYQPVIVRDVGLVVRKDDTQLLEQLNQSISKLKQEGVIKNVLQKWGL